MTSANLYNFARSETVWTVAVFLLVFYFVRRFAVAAINNHIADPRFRHQSRKLMSALWLVVGIFFVMVLFHNRLGGIGVGLSVAGAAVTFALQDVITSFAGWSAIYFGNLFRTGDRVQLGGIKGDIIDIGFLRTTLMELGEWVQGDMYNGRVVHVTNNFVFKAPVFNYSADFAFLWDEITVPIRFGSDLPLVRTLMLDAADRIVGKYIPDAEASWRHMLNRYLVDDATLPPMVTMTFNENWVIFTLRYIVEYKRRRAMKDELSAQILIAIEQSADRVNIGSGPTLITNIPSAKP